MQLASFTLEQIMYDYVAKSESERNAVMARRNNLDNRYRDIDSEIREKNNNTRVNDLRKTYGNGFAHGYAGSEKLRTVLDHSGVRSLTEYLKRK